MGFIQLTVLLVLAAAVDISSSFAAVPEYNNNVTQNLIVDTNHQQNTTAFSKSTDDTSGKGGGVDNNAVIDGIALKSLRKDEIKDLLDDEDNIIASELDIIVARKIVADRNKMDAVNEIDYAQPKQRPKRFLAIVAKAAGHVIKAIRRIPPIIYIDNRKKRTKRWLFGRIPLAPLIKIPRLIPPQRRNRPTPAITSKRRNKRWVGAAARLLSAGRNLFRGAVRAPKPTVSGSRVTQQYNRPGNYGDAVRDFNRFQPDNLRTFNKNGISGQTGTVGNHRFTVRDGSKQGSPTLEIRSPRPSGEHVRKFRYDQK